MKNPVSRTRIWWWRVPFTCRTGSRNWGMPASLDFSANGSWIDSVTTKLLPTYILYFGSFQRGWVDGVCSHCGWDPEEDLLCGFWWNKGETSGSNDNVVGKEVSDEFGLIHLVEESAVCLFWLILLVKA